MKHRYTFDDAYKGIKDTHIPVDLDDHGTRFWIKELGFSAPSTAPTAPASLPAGALSQEQDVPQV
jgi:hypothetical protein